MPSFNGEKYIRKQLESILSQLGEYDEVIVSDDSSTDNTIQIIASFNDPRIRLFEKNRFKSPVFNLQNALKHARGEFIFLSDQDDIWDGNKVHVLMALLADHDLVLSNCRLINGRDEIIQPDYFKYYFRKGRPEINFLHNLYKNPFLGCSMAFHRRVLDVALPFPERIAMHDIWIGLLASRAFKVRFTESSLFSWRRHENNVTFAITKSDDRLSEFSLFQKLNYRAYILWHLFLRLVLKKNP
jgi:glycosyltransferase involved in cell wall biosynthesis